MIIKIDDSKTGTKVWLAFHKAIALVGFVMALAGALMTIGWLWTAISETFA
jgi:hypothetical protein